MNRQHTLIGLLIVVLTLGVAPLPLGAQAAPAALGAVNFNGDGYDDLAIGVPYEAIGAEANAGAVHVLYGSPLGAEAQGSQLWTQDVAGVLDVSEAGDEFGFALAAADFDGDSFLDLAVGVHGEAVDEIPTAGVVQVFYGTATGLAAGRNEIWSQNTGSIQGEAEPDDRFGWSLTAGDFNGDGYGDLVVGVIWEDVGIFQNAGAVHVIYGSPTGLTDAGNQLWIEGADGVQGPTEHNAQFGQVLAVGDFDGNGFDDLVIGVPLADILTSANCGRVHVLYGSAAGLSSDLDDLWFQGSDGLKDSCEADDRFGEALATGDLNRDGYDDLAVGVPYEDVGNPAVPNAGAVHFIYGSATGLTAAGNWLYTEPTSGPVAPKANDNLGKSLASGDFDRNGYTDIAAGIPGEDKDATRTDTGAVQVIYFPNAPVVIQMWDQDSTGVQDVAEAGDGFGYRVAAGDWNGDGYADLAVGVPWEDILDPVVYDAGAVNVLYGSATGITEVNDEIWHQAITGLGGAPEAGDRFGHTLLTLRTKKPERLYLPIVLR